MSDLRRFQATEQNRLAREAARIEREALKRVERAQIELNKARAAVRDAISHLENRAVAHATECARWERAKDRADLMRREASNV